MHAIIAKKYQLAMHFFHAAVGTIFLGSSIYEKEENSHEYPRNGKGDIFSHDSRPGSLPIDNHMFTFNAFDAFIVASALQIAISLLGLASHISPFNKLWIGKAIMAKTDFPAFWAITFVWVATLALFVTAFGNQLFVTAVMNLGVTCLAVLLAIDPPKSKKRGRVKYAYYFLVLCGLLFVIYEQSRQDDIDTTTKWLNAVFAMFLAAPFLFSMFVRIQFPKDHRGQALSAIVQSSVESESEKKEVPSMSSKTFGANSNKMITAFSVSVAVSVSIPLIYIIGNRL